MAASPLHAWREWVSTAPPQLQRQHLHKTIVLARNVLLWQHFHRIDANYAAWIAECHRQAWMSYHGYAMKT